MQPTTAVAGAFSRAIGGIAGGFNRAGNGVRTAASNFHSWAGGLVGRNRAQATTVPYTRLNNRNATSTSTQPNSRIPVPPTSNPSQAVTGAYAAISQPASSSASASKTTKKVPASVTTQRAALKSAIKAIPDPQNTNHGVLANSFDQYISKRNSEDKTGICCCIKALKHIEKNPYMPQTTKQQASKILASSTYIGAPLDDYNPDETRTSDNKRNGAMTTLCKKLSSIRDDGQKMEGMAKLQKDCKALLATIPKASKPVNSSTMPPQPLNLITAATSSTASYQTGAAV